MIGGALTIGLLALTGITLAVTVESADRYHLKEGEIINDDLTVAASEIIIDGTVEGDLVAAGMSVVVNGTVTGDVLAAGYGVAIRGEVHDDARVAGACVEISGTIGDDLYAAASGSGFPSLKPMFPRVAMDEGLIVTNTAEIGGAGFLGGGKVSLAGEIAEDVLGAAYEMHLTGLIGGDAEVQCSTFKAEEDAKINGTLKVRYAKECDAPDGIARKADIDKSAAIRPKSSLGARIFQQVILRFLAAVVASVGLVILGLMLTKTAPNSIAVPSNAIASRPRGALLYGLGAVVLAVFLVVPAASCLFAVLAVLQGPEAVLAVVFILPGVLLLAWNLSPLITGLWLGRKLTGAPHDLAADLRTLSIGMVVIVALRQIPYAGLLVSLVSLCLAAGGIVIACAGATGESPGDVGSQDSPEVPATEI